MKQRRLTIASFLILAITILSVGFAALADNLLFDGSANVNTDAAQAAFDAKVYFKEINAVSSKDTANIIENETVSSEDKDTVQFHIASLGVKGDTAVIYATIANESVRFDANIKLDNITKGGTNPSLFDVKCYLEDDTQITEASGITVAKSTDVNANDTFDDGDTLSTKRIKIVVTLLDSPNDSSFDATIRVSLKVTAVEPEMV